MNERIAGVDLESAGFGDGKLPQRYAQTGTKIGECSLVGLVDNR